MLTPPASQSVASNGAASSVKAAGGDCLLCEKLERVTAVVSKVACLGYKPLRRLKSRVLLTAPVCLGLDPARPSLRDVSEGAECRALRGGSHQSSAQL